MFKSVNRIHFVGIGGIGMSGIAEILLQQGFAISGSDMSESDNVRELRSKGAEIYIGHNSENIHNAEVVVYSVTCSLLNNVVYLIFEFASHLEYILT
jgi:UDP-N-acetylmuramate--alanine ligase